MAISTIYWPLDLPQRILIAGYAEAPYKAKIRTEMDAAVAKQRKRFTTAAQPYTAPMIMTNQQFEDFKDFFRYTKGMGSLPFNFPQRLDPSQYEVVRFTEEDYDAGVDGIYWRVMLNLERLP